MRDRFVSLRGFLLLVGLMIGALVAPGAEAQVAAFRGDSFAAFIVSPAAGDTALVPGSGETFAGTTMWVVGVRRADALDSMASAIVSIRSSKHVADSVVANVSLYRDQNSNERLDAGDSLVGTVTGLPLGANAADFSIGGGDVLRIPFVNVVDTYIAVVRTRNDLTLNGDTIQAFLKIEGVAVKRHPDVATYTRVPAVEIEFPVFRFRADSVQLTSQVLPDTNIHPDSRVGRNPFAVFAGTIQGEMRGIMGDSLTSFGVAFQGGVADSVTSAWALLGASGETIPLTRVGTSTTWRNVALDSALTQNRAETFIVGVMVAETVQLGETISAFIPRDSITTRFRLAGPSANSASGGTFTIARQRLVIEQDALASIFRHPDSTAVDGSLGVLALSGRIAADTVSGITADTVQRFGVNLLFGGGMAATHVDSVGAVVAGETFTLVREGATDTWAATVNRMITDTAEIRIFVRAHSTTPTGGTVQAVVALDSVTALFRAAGPAAAIVSNRIVTYQRQRVTLALDALSMVGVHPDSRAVGGINGVLLASGAIMADTFTGITADSVTGFGVSLNFGGGMAWPDVESAALVVNGETFTLTRTAGTDSWATTLGTGKTIMDTAFFQVWLRVRETTPLNATVRLGIMTDSIATRLRDAGPSVPVLSDRIVTIARQRLVIEQNALASIFRHPDSTAVDGPLGVLALSGRIAADTVSGLTADTVQRFGVNLLFGGGMAATHVDSVGAVVAGETFTLTRQGVTDTWEATVNRMITDTAEIRIFVRAHSTTPTGGTVQAVVALDSVTALFRLAGPAPAIVSNRTVTYQKQRVTLQMESLGSVNAHPDSRTGGGINGVLLASGAIVADIAGIIADSVTNFGVSLNFAGMTGADVESAALVVNGETFTLARTAGTDSWATTLGTGKTIMDTAFFQVWLRARETTPLNATVRLGIMTDSIATRLRDAGPSGPTLSDRVCTFTRPRIDSSIVSLTANGFDTYHPQVASQTPFVVLRGGLNWDTLTVLTDNRDTLSAITVFFAGTAADSARNVQLQINASGPWMDMVKVSGTETVYILPALDSAITVGVDTYAVRITVAETVPLGGTITAHLLANGCTAVFSRPGPAANSDSSGVFVIASNPVVVLGALLGDTRLAPWSEVRGPHLGFETNPVVALAGVIHTNLGGVRVPATDTLTRFGVSFDSLSANLLNDSIVSVTLRLWDTAFVSFRDTALIADSTPNPANAPLARLWRLQGDTIITETQPFQVIVQIVAHERLIGETFFVRVAPDSARTYFSSAPGGDTHSGRVVTLVYPDTAQITLQPEFAVAVNQSVNPIFDTSAIIYGGNLRGLQWSPQVTDTLQNFQIEFIDGQVLGLPASDSVVAAQLIFRSDSRIVPLAPVRQYFDANFSVNVRVWGATSIDTPFSAAANHDSFWVKVWVSNNVVVNDPNNSLLARIWSDSVGTYYTADSRPQTALTSGRRLYFNTIPFNASATALADMVVSPFRAQTDSVIALTGQITSSQSPTDSLTACTVQLIGSSGFRGESVTVYLGLAPGGATPASQATLVLIDSNSSSPTFRLAGVPINIDSGQTFHVRIQADTRTLIGETVTVRINKNSAAMRFSFGSPDTISSNRIITFAYTDSTVIIDSTPAPAALDVHPDSRMGQNPFVLFQGGVKGQTATASLADTLQRVGFVMTGTAAESVIAAWIVFDGNETVTLTPVGAGGWAAALDSTVLFGAVRNFTLHARVADTTTRLSTLGVTIPADSFRMFFTAETVALTGARTVTFQTPTVGLTLDTQGERTIHPDSRITAFPITVISGRIDTAAVGGTPIATDTLTSFTLNLGDDLASPLATADIESAALVINATETVLTKSGLRLSWSGIIGIADSATFAVRLWVHPTADGRKIRPFIGPDSLVMALRESGPVAAVRNASDTVHFARPALRVVMGARPLDQPATIRTSMDTRAIAVFTVASDHLGDSLAELTVTLAADSSRVAIQSIYLVRDANGDSLFTYGVDTIISAMIPTSSLAGESRYIFTRGNENTLIDTKVYMVAARFNAMDDEIFRIRIAPSQAAAVFMAAGPAALQSYDTFRLVAPDTVPPASPATLTVSSLDARFTLTFPQSTDTTSWKNGILGGQYNIYIGAKGGGIPNTFLTRIFHDATRAADWTVTVTADSILAATGSAPVDGDSYAFRVKAMDLAGNEGVAAMTVTGIFRVSASAPLFSATLLAPTAGQIVFRSPAVFFSAAATGVDRNLIVGVRFQVTDSVGTILVSDTSTAHVDAAASNRIFTAALNLDGLASGQTYLIRAIARIATGTDTYAAYSSFTLTTNAGQANYLADTSAGMIALCTQTLYGAAEATAFSAGDNAARVEEFPVASARTIVMTTPSAGTSILIEIPADALTGASGMVRCTVVLGRTGTNGSGMSDTARRALRRAGLIVSPYWFEFRPAGDTTLRGGRRATITMTTIDRNNDDICDSTGIALDRAVIYTLNAANELEALQLVARGPGFLRFSTSHFSPFFFAPDTGFTTAGLNRLIVGPNPWRPNDGNDQTGKPYVVGDMTTGIIFRNLPPSVKIEIYTILGEKVIEITKNNAASGQINWSGRNADGRNVASGYYLYVVTDQSTGQRVTGKVAVIR